MKVVVLVSEAAAIADNFEIEETTISDTYLEYGLNEWDEFAVEEAVQLAESATDQSIEVIAVTIGPTRSEETLRTVLAKGVDRAIRIWDDALEGITLLDVRTKAALLSAVVSAEEPDVILSGVQSADDLFGATGVTLADEIGYAWAAVVNHTDFHVEEQTVTIHRELEGGLKEVVVTDLPAVLTIQTGINEPRYASLRGIRQAQAKPIESRSMDDLDLSHDIIDANLIVTSMSVPESDTEPELFEGSPEDSARQLASLLIEEGVVAE